MRAWGPGLYSDDFAADLKTTVGTLCRLPFSGEEIVEILVELNPAASNSADEEHTTFWLVVADQFQRRASILMPETARSRSFEKKRISTSSPISA
jgi:hypothetical protein